MNEFSACSFLPSASYLIKNAAAVVDAGSLQMLITFSCMSMEDLFMAILNPHSWSAHQRNLAKLFIHLAWQPNLNNEMGLLWWSRWFIHLIQGVFPMQCACDARQAASCLRTSQGLQLNTVNIHRIKKHPHSPLPYTGIYFLSDTILRFIPMLLLPFKYFILNMF